MVLVVVNILAVADPGFPVGATNLVGGCQLPTRLCLVKFVCPNERIGTPTGGAQRVCPLDPPMTGYSHYLLRSVIFYT